MPYFFTPPTYTLKNVNAGPLLSRFQTTYAVSIVKRGSSFESVTHPDLTIFADPTVNIVYQGGHRYLVSDVEAGLLTSAGFAAGLSPLTGGYSDIYVDVFGD
jgi:hypothetical protein